MLNQHFSELTKAYKALTDEEIRNNFVQFGHPDGKQAFSIGIALPVWIVSEGGSYYVLAVYGLLFGILLPYTVGRWWYGTKKHTRDGVLMESAGSLFRTYDENTDEKKLVSILTVGEEMKQVTGGKREKEWIGSEEATIEKKIREAGVPERELAALQELDGWQRRACGLLWAYLYRVDLGSEKLENGMFQCHFWILSIGVFVLTVHSQIGCCSCSSCVEQEFSCNLTRLQQHLADPCFNVFEPESCPGHRP